jgi:hypothetical protein
MWIDYNQQELDQDTSTEGIFRKERTLRRIQTIRKIREELEKKDFDG